jgi:hypothetical protein
MTFDRMAGDRRVAFKREMTSSLRTIAFLKEWGMSSDKISALQAVARDRTSFANLIAYILALAFVLYGLIAVGILAIKVPPFKIQMKMGTLRVLRK